MAAEQQQVEHARQVPRDLAHGLLVAARQACGKAPAVLGLELRSSVSSAARRLGVRVGANGPKIMRRFGAIVDDGGDRR